MRALFIGLGVIVVLILGTLFVVPSLIPSETYRTTIQQQLTQELGREVVIEGDVSLSTFPLIKAKTGRATIANPDGFSRDVLASLDGLEARIKLLPLFSKRVEIASFTLVRPDILLERLADGRVNWQIGAAPTTPATPAEPTGPFKRDGRYANVDPSLGAFRIEDGRLLFVDAVANTRRELTDINVQLALPNMTETLGLEGTLQLDGDPLRLDVSLDSPRAFLDGRETRLRATLETDGANLSLDGTIPPGTEIAFNGSVDGTLSDVALIKDFLPEPVPALDSLSRAALSAELSSTGGDGVTQFSDLELTAEGEAFDLSFTGAGQYDDALSLTGQYALTVPDAGPFARRFLPDLTADADLAGAVTSTGTVAINGETIRVTDLVAETKSNVVTSRYNGTLTMIGDDISANGTVSANIPSMTALNAASTTDIPYSDALGSVSVTARVSGKTDNLAIDDIVADLRDGDINGQYRGRATVTDTVSLAGDLSVTGQSLRTLAAQSGTVLPPSTNKGPVFETFGLSGTVSGPVDDLTLSQAKLALDELSATGRFALSMQGTQPTLTGTLTLPGLDLRPYMAAYSAQRPEGAIQPWSETAIPTSGLRAIDADLSLSTPSIKLPRLSLGATQARAQLTNGVLTTTIPEVALYGGSGQATVVLDGSAAEPVIDITAGLNSLQAQNFLGAVAGFTQASGMGATEISLKGRGASQVAIMKSLTGDGNFSLKDGSISGIDAGEFLTGLQQALTARSLPGGLGPQKTTQFKNLIGNFSMTDGVAKIDAFALNAAQVQVEGSGQIDLGNQTLDVRLRPKTVGEKASGLAAFGIPLRFSGPFGAAKPQLDQEFLGQVIQARAAAEAQNLITSQIGGTSGDVVGGVLGSILGNKKPAPAAETPAPSNPEPETAPESESETEPKPKEETTEDKVENALRGLFGGKKDD